MYNTNRSSYVRNIELISESLNTVCKEMALLNVSLTKEGYYDLAARLQELSQDIKTTHTLLGTTVIEESQRMISFLKEAPLARSQDLGVRSTTYPTVHIDET